MSWYTLSELHWFVTPMVIYPNAKKQLIIQIFLVLLEFQES